MPTSTSPAIVPEFISADEQVSREDAPGPEVGQWYWVTHTDYKDEVTIWLGCITLLGSNFAELKGPSESRGNYVSRILFDDFHKVLRLEPNAEQVLKEKVQHYQDQVHGYMQEVKNLTARLGVSTQVALSDATASQSQSLVVMSGQAKIDDYKNALVKAQKEDLPALFKKMAEANEALSSWLSAESIPMVAMAESLKGSIKAVENRIFNVSLYAGLTEEIVQIRQGEPAAYAEKLSIMQRRLYMDEECLMNYRHGGMEFKDIHAFDSWIAEDDNMQRLLPFPRCMVAMRVRRLNKERSWDGKLLNIFVNFRASISDKKTYFFIRNGDNLYRMDCDLEFDELIFPDATTFDPSEPMMVRMFGNSVKDFMSVREYESVKEEIEAQKSKHKAWVAEHGKEYAWRSPFRYDEYRLRDFVLFSDKSVYFDEINAELSRRIQYYNRIALIIQGLFDRSETLHPHPPVKTWTHEGFNAAITLVADGSHVLSNGNAPDFEAYRAKCNAKMNTNSVVVGQERFWMLKEAEKENKRLDNDWRNKSDFRHSLFTPRGNEGPGYLAKLEHWSKNTQKATFSWYRERLRDNAWDGHSSGDKIRTSITVPAEELFNVSAYQPGDYKQFFQDSRTRADYLKWAPMLLAAEEFHAGKSEAQLPAPKSE